MTPPRPLLAWPLYFPAVFLNHHITHFTLLYYTLPLPDSSVWKLKKSRYAFAVATLGTGLLFPRYCYREMENFCVWLLEKAAKDNEWISRNRHERSTQTVCIFTVQ